MGQSESKHDSEQPWTPTKSYEKEWSVYSRLDPKQVSTPGGGYAWKVDDLEFLTRFLFLGSDDTYNVSDNEPERKHLKCIDRLIANGRGKQVVNLICDLGEPGRTPRQNYIIFALAICARSNDVETKQMAYKSIDKICRIPTHLFMFLAYCQQESGECRKPKGWGRAHKRAVMKWYENKCNNAVGFARLLTKYKRRTFTRRGYKETWSHKKVFRLAHPSPKNDVMKVMQRYIMRGFEAASDLVNKEMGSNVEVLKLLSFLEATEKAKKCHNENELVHLITGHKLEREHVPTQMLRSEKVCQALVMNMKTEAKLRNLCMISSKGLCTVDSKVEKEVVDTLNDKKLLRDYRVHPFRVLLALLSYKTGTFRERKRIKGRRTVRIIKWEANTNVKQALDRAFMTSFANIGPTGKRFLLAVNVSRGMKVPCVGSKGIRCDQAAAAMMMTLVRTQTHYKILSFSNELKRIWLEKSDTLEHVLHKMEETRKKLKEDRTDCALPVLWAKENKKKVDVFVVYTDNVTSIGKMHASEAFKKYREEMQIPNAKFIVVAMASNKFTVAGPEKRESGMMNIVGFDTDASVLIAQFYNDLL